MLKVLDMQIRNYFYSSVLYKALSRAFVTDRKILLSESTAGKIFQKAYYPYVTEVCLFLSVLLFWYEGLLLKYTSFLSSSMLASGLLVIGLLLAKKENIFFSKAQLWYLTFLAVSLVSALFAVSRGIDSHLLISGWFLFAQFGLAMFATQGIMRKENILKSLVWLSVPLSAMGLYQFVFRIKTSSVWVSSFEKGIDTRAFAFFGSPNILGILLAVMMFIAIGLYVKSRNKWYLGSIFLDILVVGLTFSRSAWLGLVAGLIFMLIIYKPKMILWSPIAALLLLIPQLRDRIFIIFSDKYLMDSSLDGRVWSFINGMHLFKKYPIFGTGPGSYGGTLAARSASPVYLESIQKGYTALYFTDNQFVEILVQTGVLGLITFTAFFISILWGIVDKFKEKRDIMVLTSGAAFVCFIVSGSFANVLEFGAIAVPIGIIIGSALGTEEPKT